MGDKSIACKECIFGNHERKTCYLESSCEVMHEWLRKHDIEVRNKAIDDLLKQVQFEEKWLFDTGTRSQDVKIAFSGIYMEAKRLKS